MACRSSLDRISLGGLKARTIAGYTCKVQLIKTNYTTYKTRTTFEFFLTTSQIFHLQYCICFPAKKKTGTSLRWCTSGHQSSISVLLLCRIGSIIINSLHTQTAWRVSQPTWATHFKCCSLYTTWYVLIIEMHEIGGLQYNKYWLQVGVSTDSYRFFRLHLPTPVVGEWFWTPVNPNSDQGWTWNSSHTEVQ